MEQTLLTPEQAESLLPEGDTVHTFLNNSVGILVGADWDRADVVQAIREADEIHVTGEHAQAMKHGICLMPRRLFVEAVNWDERQPKQQESPA